MSPLDFALEAEISQRHLSIIPPRRHVFRGLDVLDAQALVDQRSAQQAHQLCEYRV
ncbi:MAG TPA: hypothetical protein VGM81_23755 [Burkholderiaceae bacterium]|jgi:hypothetical protein